MRRKKKSREADEPQQYVFHVEAVHSDYSFSLNPVRNEVSPYSEYFHPKVTARLLIPAMPEVSEAELVFIGNRELMHELQAPDRNMWDQRRPEAIGFIEVRDGRVWKEKYIY